MIVKRKHTRTLRARYHNPADAAKFLVDTRGRNGAMHLARDRESSFGPHSEWWHDVLDAIGRMEVAAPATHKTR